MLPRLCEYGVIKLRSPACSRETKRNSFIQFHTTWEEPFSAALYMCVVLALKPWQTRRKERDRGELQKLSFSVVDQKCAAGKEGGSTHIGATRLARVARKVSSTANFSKSYAPREDAVRPSVRGGFHDDISSIFQSGKVNSPPPRRRLLAHLLIQH